MAGPLLVAGLVVAALGRARPLPVGGVAVAAAGLWSIAEVRSVPGAVLVGVAGVGLAAALASVRRIPAWCCLALAVPFGWAIGFHGGIVEATWVRVLVTAGAAAGGMLAAAFDDAWRRAAPGPGLLALSVAGAYFAVPDTEEIAALFGAVLPIAALGWPLGLVRLGRAGAATAVATLVWVAAIDGRGRPASIVGAVACLGLLAGAPVGRTLRRRADSMLGGLPEPVVIVLLGLAHLAIVVVASRAAGTRVEPLEAGAIAVVAGVAAVALGTVLQPDASVRATPTRQS